MEHDHAGHRRELFAKKASASRRRLFGMVYRRTHDAAFSEDMVHETFIRFLHQMEETGWALDINKEDAYLNTILRRCLIDKWRGESKRECVSLDALRDDSLLEILELPEAEKQIYLDELLRQIPWKTILKEISAENLHLIHLHAIQSMTYKQIADELGEHQVLVRYRIQSVYATIRARLRRILGKQSLFKRES